MIIGLLVLGLLMGQPLNLIIDRLPLRRPLLGSPACTRCEQRRPWQSVIPFTTWWLGIARCPSCDTAPGRRTLLVNLALPLAGTVLWLRRASNPIVFLYLAIAAYFIAIVAIDLEHRLVLNRMTAIGLVSATGIAAFGLGPSVQSTVIGAVVGFLFLWLPALILPGLGMGDVKLAAVIGALVGYPAVLSALVFGVLAGGVAAGLLLLTRRIERRGTMAYAPYLVVGVSLVLFGLVG